MELRTALKPALVVEAVRFDTGAPDSLAVIEFQEALVEALFLPKQDGVSEAMVYERNPSSNVLESTSPNATEAPDPGSGEQQNPFLKLPRTMPCERWRCS